VHDVEDEEVPYADATRLGDLLGARVLRTQGLGHRRILFAPEVVSAIVEFIEAGRPAPSAHVPELERQS
jgi:hypothetical protein